MGVHYFLIEDLEPFLANLVATHFSMSRSDPWIVYSKIFSGAIVKHYAYPAKADKRAPIRVRVTYDILKDGLPLGKHVKELKGLNRRYRESLPGWKTKPDLGERVRQSRWIKLQRFFHKHSELIYSFKYKGDERLTEGNYLFNLQIASTPRHQRLCMEFIKVLVDAQAPHGIVRSRREADRPVRQRNGWIKRYALVHKKRGWNPREIARDIQKELRNGTWNERSRIRYNIADNTICKIAGMKIAQRASPLPVLTVE